MNDVGGFMPSDEVPEADAVEQQLPADFPDESDLDTSSLTTTDREANEADVIDQAIEVPVPDDERDIDY
ncbi:hypothetical protein A5791_24090 [Mycobacterium sp. 852002-51163_SCH5372311]|nr:hypothetical protein A5791_24090 [Mycobacterium sp. 852002-51163_SCH5372311]